MLGRRFAFLSFKTDSALEVDSETLWFSVSFEGLKKKKICVTSVCGHILGFVWPPEEGTALDASWLPQGLNLNLKRLSSLCRLCELKPNSHLLLFLKMLVDKPKTLEFLWRSGLESDGSSSRCGSGVKEPASSP